MIRGAVWCNEGIIYRSVQEMDDSRIIIKTKMTLALRAWRQGLLICWSTPSFLQVVLGCRMGQTEEPTA